MTDQEYPFIPPYELVQEWGHDANLAGVPYKDDTGDWLYEQHIATRAAQWGADQELEACCEALDNLNDGYWSEKLRAARRPKLLNLKEQALDVLHLSFDRGYLKEEAVDTIRRALEQLND